MPLLITPMESTTPSASPFTEPASHEVPAAWQIFHDSDDGIFPVGDNAEGGDLSELLGALIEQTGDDRLSFVSIETRDAGIEIENLTASDFDSALMAMIVDETPDDAPDTDDHPLEEIRSAVQDIIDADPLPSPV